MNASRSLSIFFKRASSVVLIIAAFGFSRSKLHAQEFKVFDSLHRIAGVIESGTGLIQVRLAGFTNASTLDPSLDFFNKSFFSCSIGSTICTNENPANVGTIMPAGTVQLTYGVTSSIKDIYGHT